jgi:hypothetical protein
MWLDAKPWKADLQQVGIVLKLPFRALRPWTSSDPTWRQIALVPVE